MNRNEPPAAAAGQRLAYVDAAKGVCLLLVMLSHIARCPQMEWVSPFMVGAFFVLSGYTFKRKPDESFAGFAKAKWLRLVRPYFIFNLALLLLYSVAHPGLNLPRAFAGVAYSRYSLVPGGQGEALLFAGNAPTWFLTALFCSSLLFYPLVAAHTRRARLTLAALYLLLAEAARLLPLLLPWSLDSAPLFALLMYGGYCIKEWPPASAAKGKSVLLSLALLLLYATVAALNGSVNLSVRLYGHSLPAEAAACLAATALLLVALHPLQQSRASRLLALWGRNSLAIFSIHLPILLAADKILRWALPLSLYQNELFFMAACLAAVGIALGIGLLVSRRLPRILPRRLYLLLLYFVAFAIFKMIR